MIVEKVVEIPSTRRLYIDVPMEVPEGKAIITFTPASLYNDLASAKAIWNTNNSNHDKMKKS